MGTQQWLKAYAHRGRAVASACVLPAVSALALAAVMVGATLFLGCAASGASTEPAEATRTPAGALAQATSDTQSDAQESGQEFAQGGTSLHLEEGVSAAQSNTEALQSAIDEASESGSGVVLLEPGEFYFAWSGVSEDGNFAIAMRDNVTVVGAGMEETVLKPYGEYSKTGEAPHGIDMFYYDGFVSGGYLNNANFKNFTIDAEATRGDPGQYNASGKGFFFKLFKDCNWEWVTVKNTDGTGFGADFPVNCTMSYCVAMNCGKNATYSSIGASGFGVGIGHSSNESMILSDCVSNNNTKFGYFFEHQTIFGAPWATAAKAEGFNVVDCTASGNLVNFGGNRSHDTRFTNCVSQESPDGMQEMYTDYAFDFQNGSVRVSVENSAIDQAYQDISESSPYFEAVSWALSCNVAQVGLGGRAHFDAGDAITRAEAAEFLWRYAGRPGDVVLGWTPVLDLPFADVPENAYYANAVKWFKEDGITKAGLYRPDEKATVGELLTFLWRYACLLDEEGSEASEAAKAAGGTLEAGQAGGGSPGPNRSTDSDFAAASAWAESLGIVPESLAKVSPESPCTRGQAMQMLHAFHRARSQGA